ncbi:MAG: 2Fe-2S iron-sulfur cluster-binding protein [Gammaproteobacteria bacterium]
MPKVTFIDHAGAETVVDAPAGFSVMEAAIENNIAGIDADCGGCLSCATCHVFVDPAWIDKLPTREDDELDMLDCTAEDSTDNSRLSCQIKLTDELDGITVTMPEHQS